MTSHPTNHPVSQDLYKIAVSGASSLAGKELSECLTESFLAASDFVLMDEDEAIGQLEQVGDEPIVIQRTEAGSFDRMDFVFFAGNAEATRKHWGAALRAGASIVDLTGALEGEPKVLVRAPWVSELLSRTAPESAALPDFPPDLSTSAIVPAHPAAAMFALVMARLHGRLKPRSIAATLLEPASQHGRAAMDELHQQTVGVLSFQTLPHEQYEAQLAFSVLSALGEGAKVRSSEDRIRAHYALLSSGRLPELGLQVAQAPVFHGYVASMMVEFAEPVRQDEIEAALQGDHMDVLLGEGEPPNNMSVSGQEDVQVQVRPEPPGSESGTRYWLWVGADNLKLGAMNAIACAQELRRMRPHGKVQ